MGANLLWMMKISTKLSMLYMGSLPILKCSWLYRQVRVLMILQVLVLKIVIVKTPLMKRRTTVEKLFYPHIPLWNQVQIVISQIFSRALMKNLPDLPLQNLKEDLGNIGQNQNRKSPQKWGVLAKVLNLILMSNPWVQVYGLQYLPIPFGLKM